MARKIKKTYAKIDPNKYTQSSVRQRIEAAFLDNIGKVLTGEQLSEVARGPQRPGRVENWHQRLSELRTDFGYTILSHRDREWLKPGEYLMPSVTRNPKARRRVKVSPRAWKQVLERAGDQCEWREGGKACELKAGDIDPVGGGTVHLTPDHKTPHAAGEQVDPEDPDQWMALCGRHQVVKKNFWDHASGKLNAYAIVQAASVKEKRQIYKFLKQYFGDA